MALSKLIRKFLTWPVIRRSRWVCAESAVGLAISWLILFPLELWRPGIVSLYLDLNVILLLALLTWLIGLSLNQSEK